MNTKVFNTCCAPYHTDLLQPPSLFFLPLSLPLADPLLTKVVDHDVLHFLQCGQTFFFGLEAELQADLKAEPTAEPETSTALKIGLKAKLQLELKIELEVELNRISAIGRYIGQTRSYRFLTATYLK